jgi:hypothetical protein
MQEFFICELCVLCGEKFCSSIEFSANYGIPGTLNQVTSVTLSELARDENIGGARDKAAERS